MSELATIAESVNNLNDGQVSVYSSIKGEDFESKKRVLNATTNAENLSDHLNETINLVDVVVQAIDLTDDQTGEQQEAARVILIDADGNSYAAVSTGIFRALTNMFGILGHPHTWGGPLAIKVIEEKGRRGFKFFTIRLVEDDAPVAKSASK